MKAINSNQDADFVIQAPSEVDDGKIISYENFVNAIICNIPSKILFEKNLKLHSSCPLFCDFFLKSI